MFLHGAGDANILHEDGLDHANPVLPAMGTVDVLIANPPYSVKDFKQHLDLKANRFDLLPHLTASSGEIETLFVERATQLLRPGGVAGIILPSSILSNSGIYRRTRALLLENFLLRGIVELGGSAFIATGTNTVVLFLERRPATYREHFAIRAEALFHEEKVPNDADFADSKLLRAYTAAAGLAFDDYRAWLADPDGELPTVLAETPLFTAYAREFEALAETRRRREQVSFKKLPLPEREAEMRGKFLRYCREAEKEKFLFFALAHAAGLEDGELVPQRTTILRTAGDKNAEQTFLGYKWSQRRGAEGMVWMCEPYDGGSLYSPGEDSREEPAHKAAHHFRRAFTGEEPDAIPEDSPLAEKLRVVATTECLDFTQTSFDLTFNLSPAEADATPAFDTKYQLVRFNDVATLEYGKPLPERSRIDGHFPVMGSNGEVGRHNEYLIEGPAIIVGRKGSAGRVTFVSENCYPIDTTFFVAHDSKQTDLKYLNAILNELRLEEHAKALGVPGLNRNDVYKIPIPLPPLAVQRKIVKAIEEVEREEAEARAKMAAIEEIIRNTITAAGWVPNPPDGESVMFEDVLLKVVGSTAKIQTSEVEDAGKWPVISQERQFITGYTSKDVEPITDLPLVIFGDHSREVKYIDFPFVRGADGVVLLKSDKRFHPRAFFYLVKQIQITAAQDYTRHFKYLKSIRLPIKPLPEQEKLLAEIEPHERARTEAKSHLAAAPSRKRQMLLAALR